MLTDTHCHLDFDRFDDDRAAVIERASRAGIEKILNPGVEILSSKASLVLSSRYDCIFSAVGIHPNDAETWNDQSLAELQQLAQSPKVVAIGEIGLDYYWERTEHELQVRILQEQLSLAKDLALPVIIHIRDKDIAARPALSDALNVLADWIRDLVQHDSAIAVRPGVLHSFSGDLAAAKKAVDLNLCLGIGGPVTYKKADILHKVVREVPLECLLTETDAPFLTPEPLRGRRNEPGHVRLIAEQIARLRRDEAGQIEQSTTSNAERLFHW